MDLRLLLNEASIHIIITAKAQPHPADMVNLPETAPSRHQQPDATTNEPIQATQDSQEYRYQTAHPSQVSSTLLRANHVRRASMSRHVQPSLCTSLTNGPALVTCICLEFNSLSFSLGFGSIWLILLSDLCRAKVLAWQKTNTIRTPTSLARIGHETQHFSILQKASRFPPTSWKFKWWGFWGTIIPNVLFSLSLFI